MNYLIQRAKVRGQMIDVPSGLPELLSDITREVLRCQPTNECMCQFVIDYLHSVIVTREKAMVAKTIIDRALRMVDEIIGDLCICDITKAKAEDMANLMELCFRRFLERKRCERSPREYIKFNESDIIEELIQKCKFTEYDLKMSRPLIEDAYKRFVHAYLSTHEATEGTEALYQYLRDRERHRSEVSQRNTAAIIIQRNFRGYIARKKFVSSMPGAAAKDMSADEWERRNNAARILQKFFRRVRTFKSMSAKKDATPPPPAPPPAELCAKSSATSLTVKQALTIAQQAQPPPPAAMPPTEVAVVESSRAEENVTADKQESDHSVIVVESPVEVVVLDDAAPAGEAAEAQD